MTSCIVGFHMGDLLFVLSFVCSFFFLSKFFVKDISTTVKDRNFIFGIKVHNDKLYRGIDNGPSPICSSLYLFFFLSLHFFTPKISPQPVKIETLNLMHRFTRTSCIVGLKTAFSYLFFAIFCSFFFLSGFFVRDISTTVSNRNFKFGIEVRNKLYCEIANRHSPICSSLPFSFCPDFSSKISPQPFKIETSNLVYRFTMTSCILESKMGLLQFVLPYICSFFCLSRFFVKEHCGIEKGPSPICSSLYLFFFLSFQIFRQRYLHNRFKIETSNLV